MFGRNAWSSASKTVTYDISGDLKSYVIDYPAGATIRSVEYEGYFEYDDPDGGMQSPQRIEFSFASPKERDRCLSSLRDAVKSGDITIKRHIVGSFDEDSRGSIGDASLGLDPCASGGFDGKQIKMVVELVDHNQDRGMITNEALGPLLRWMADNDWLTQANVAEIVKATATIEAHEKHGSNELGLEHLKSQLSEHLQGVAQDAYDAAIATRRGKGSARRTEHAANVPEPRDGHAEAAEERSKTGPRQPGD